MSHVGARESVAPRERAVARAIVGEDALDPDLACGEPVRRALPERGGGRTLFVVEDLRVRDPSAVVDDGVQVPVTDRGPSPSRSVPATVDPPTTTVGDPGERLHVDVDELTGLIMFIATHRLTIRCAVTAVQSPQTLMPQHVLHSRRRDPQLMADVISAPAALHAQPNDLPATRPR